MQAKLQTFSNTTIMKNFYLLLVVSIVLLGCKKQEPGTVAGSMYPATRDCYKVQALNEYGEVINDNYECMLYVDNYGDDFQSAYDNLESTFNGWKDALYEENKNSEYWDADRIEIRTTPCAVYNTPNDTLEYKSVDFFMYNISPYKDYIIVTYYLVIDSKGNAYSREPGDD